MVKKALCLRGKGIVLALVIFGFTDCALAISGNDWKTIPASAQEAYIMAVVDTWRNAAYMCRETSYTDKQNPASKTFNCEFFDRMNRQLESCFKNSPYSQLIEIVTKYMAGNPQMWHNPMAFISFRAFNDACLKLQP